MKKLRPWIEPQFSQIFNDPEVPFLGLRKLPIIIGLCGPTKCGKTIMAEHLVTDHDFQYESLATIIEELARNQGVEELSWQVLDKIAEDFRELQESDIFARILMSRIKQDLNSKKRIVIDDLVHPAEVRYLQQFPFFTPIGIEASSQVRAKAASVWYGKSIETNQRLIEEQDKYEQYGFNRHNKYASNISACIKIARKSGEIIRVVGALTKKTIFDHIDQKARKILGQEPDHNKYPL